MTNINILNNAIDILIHSGMSSTDHIYINKYRDEFIFDTVPEGPGKLFGTIETDEHGKISYILMLSKSEQNAFNIRGLWVRPELRGKNIATALLSTVRRITKGSKGVTVFVPFNDKRFALANALMRNGYKHQRYIASISASEYTSNW